MKKFILHLFSLCCLISNVYCADKLTILHSPSALRFRGNEDLYSSNLKNVFSTSLGYSVEAEDAWNGLEVKKPFGFAECLFVFHFPGITSLNTGTDGSYSILPDENIEETWNALNDRTEQRYPDRSLELKKIIIGDQVEVYQHQDAPYVVQVPSNGPIESIDSPRLNSENDNMLIKELNKLHAVVDQFISKSKKDGVPDLYWVSIPNMSKIIELRGADSKEILINALTTLSDKMKKVYNEKVLIAALTDSETTPKSRAKRETTEAGTKITVDSLNVATDYDTEFPVIFNIIFWFSLAMLFAVFAICMVIGGMDPGRDSIIYRMTSTRMKKDN